MFWDSSALIPWLVPEARSAEITQSFRSDAERIVWWATPVECLSALYRRHREQALPSRQLDEAHARLHALAEEADFIAPTDRVRERAGRLLAGHPLRAADAFQLAAALVWCDEAPRGDGFVCLDERLRVAARREGFAVLPT